MNIVLAVEPEGYKAWSEKAKATLAAHPEVFTTPKGGVDHDGGKHVKKEADGRTFVRSTPKDEYDEREVEWDGEKDEGPELEGTRTTEERRGQKVLGLERPGIDTKTVVWEPEPPLNADQIVEIENKIGGGLIEEVIQVAEGELKLADTMLKAAV